MSISNKAVTKVLGTLLAVLCLSTAIASNARANVFDDLQEAREAESIGMTVEQYQRKKARRQRDNEMGHLRQNGMSASAAARCVYNGRCSDPAPVIIIQQPRQRRCSVNVIGGHVYRNCY